MDLRRIVYDRVCERVVEPVVVRYHPDTHNEEFMSFIDGKIEMELQSRMRVILLGKLANAKSRIFNIIQ